MPPVPVTRTDVSFGPDSRRVIAKPFVAGSEAPLTGSRVERILSRILAMEEAVVVATLAATYQRFSSRHSDLASLLEQRFASVACHLPHRGDLSVERRRLIGAYFTQEYSIDAAALSNPSIVSAPNQQGLAPDAHRFIMSLRAIGEGHVSSIQFRSGVIDARGGIEIDEPSRYLATARHRAPIYEKQTFRAKLMELGSFSDNTTRVLDALPDHFTLERLEETLLDLEDVSAMDEAVGQATRTIHWLASSNYECAFEAGSSISERVLFPSGPAESHGMEDARFVRFSDDDGVVRYFAPYTAWDGYRILPQLIETRDFVSFRIVTLNGPAAVNKGIALFPRKIDGRFVALARLDNENNHLIRSDNVHFWHDRETIQVPEQPWELIQIGNAGSPLETEAGWLVITHGVGPLRRYALGAILLDRDDPARIIGRLEEPLLAPEADERDGYVPNVVYSCGSMILSGMLVLPYGFSDVGARIATVRLEDLLAELTRRN
jgi:predicted GH43/DUF377 family glycosyl hydrolase